MKRIIWICFFVLCFVNSYAKDYFGLTLIPSGKITNKVNLDIRGGIVNNSAKAQTYRIYIYWNKEVKKNLLRKDLITISANKSSVIKLVIPTNNRVGKNKVIFKVVNGKKISREIENIEVINSKIRSIKEISGAWAGIYHWSEEEGKHWNQDIKKMTDSQWKELVCSMNKVKMNTIVIQEVFRNSVAAGGQVDGDENYKGKAFYPSKLYPGRMDITAKDPIGAILDQADKLGTNVFIGVGNYAWFDFSLASLEWHKRVAKELWDRYGYHKSFYGFYVSEESGGGLDNWEKDLDKQKRMKYNIVNFFKEFKHYCSGFAPDKPIMLATNSFDVPHGMDTYPSLLKYLDILCPFGFARMPDGDITGKEAADMLQKACDDAHSHLWFDLEAFLFNSDKSLYPRPVNEIIKDLNMFDNFEKILCYQYPGVFNDPQMSIRIGEARTIDLFNGYMKYLKDKNDEK